jgi:hypothetical protein
MAKATQQPEAASGLKPEVASVYELAEGTRMVFMDSELNEVDLSKINLEFAHRVAAKGYLVKKKP